MNATYFIFFNVASRKCKTMHMTCNIYLLNSPVLGGNREVKQANNTAHKSSLRCLREGCWFWGARKDLPKEVTSKGKRKNRQELVEWWKGAARNKKGQNEPDHEGPMFIFNREGLLFGFKQESYIILTVL